MKRLHTLLFFGIVLIFNQISGQAHVPASTPTAPLIDVWDFGAEQLDAGIYNNQLSVSIINSWYATSITPGSANSTNTLPTSWTAGKLKWTSNSATSDRLRTANTALTRYDTQVITTIGDSTLSGYLYVNSSASSSRYFTMDLTEDDEVTLYVKNQNGTGRLNFVYIGTGGVAQSDITAAGAISSTTGAVIKFQAKNTGNYKIYDSVDKPFYYRILRKSATYQTFTGNIDVTQAPALPAGYKVVFTNASGKSWSFTESSNTYSATVPAGYTYNVTLQDANGYIIASEKTIAVTTSTTNFDLSLLKVTLYTLSGSITGLGTTINNLSLAFTPATPSPFVPEPVVDKVAGTYSVQLMDGLAYTAVASGINDYQLTDNSAVVSGANATKELAFSLKTKYNVTINTSGLTVDQIAKLSLTFANLNEAGYSYTFAPAAAISLRNGTYSVVASGLDEYAVKQALTSNLKVLNADISKTVTFKKENNWSFDDKTITSSVANYKGMKFTGNISNEIAKGHILCKSTATIKVPVAVGEKVKVTYYYTADFSIEGGTAITTASNSTSNFESTTYVYSGVADGYVTITIGAGASTTYITDITTETVVPYVSDIYVGADKTYKTINEALSAVSKMSRPTNQRVNIIIDPGNYEEMLTITTPNVTLKNASATPSIALANNGVDINSNAVRITSYYGHGYNYYSMGTDQKWNAELLAVNKENGNYSYTNTGSGTTNGSYWNATVVVGASGFKAQDIIFENSYNQYVSLKESQDVVVEWTSGGKGTRPTTVGSTTVQNKSYVERAAAIAFMNNADTAVLYKCRVIGRQDTFYGGTGVRVVVYKGVVMGGTDYIFGPMTAVFYQTDLAMNTMETNTDVSYITAAQQLSGRGYLMYECNITSAQPGTETASQYLSKPGYFGRPWAPTTSEVVFYNTTIGTTNFPGNEGQSFIVPAGWLNSLSGESNKMYEYGTTEVVNNTASRVTWCTVLSNPVLNDATQINTFNFTKGSDNWNPLPALVVTKNDKSTIPLSVEISTRNNRLYISGVKSPTTVQVFGLDGLLAKSVILSNDNSISLSNGIWIVKTSAENNQKTAKIFIK